jgi:hypothetical protein
LFPEYHVLSQAMPSVSACACSCHSCDAAEWYHDWGVWDLAMEWLRECCLQRSIRQVACPCRSSARRLRLDVGRERGLYLFVFSLEEFVFSRNDLRSTPSLKTWCIAVEFMVVVVLGKIAFRRQCAGPRHFGHFLWYK